LLLLPLLLLLSRAGAGGAEGESFYKGTDVVTLTDGNFQEEVMDSDDIWFVEVGAVLWAGGGGDKPTLAYFLYSASCL
jgi:hypothetical protein